MKFKFMGIWELVLHHLESVMIIWLLLCKSRTGSKTRCDSDSDCSTSLDQGTNTLKCWIGEVTCVTSWLCQKLRTVMLSSSGVDELNYLDSDNRASLLSLIWNYRKLWLGDDESCRVYALTHARKSHCNLKAASLRPGWDFLILWLVLWTWGLCLSGVLRPEIVTLKIVNSLACRVSTGENTN